jgi:hypothetical protein
VSDDVRERLEDAGSSPVTGPDPAFADALEARLRLVAATLPPHQPRRRAFGFGRAAAGAGVVLAAAALLVIIGVSAMSLRPGPAPVPTLAGSVNVEVELADGTVLEDPNGLLLPEGAVVTVNEGGSARIGDTVLSPGDVATVRDGRIDVERAPIGVRATPTGVSMTPPPPTPTAAPPARTASPVPTGRPDQSAGSTAAPTRQPDPTGRPVTAAPTATSAPAILRPRLRARLLDGPRIAVTWTETLRARSYVLVVTRSRSGPARDPVYPGSRVLGEFATPPETPLRYRVPDGIVEVRLMVVALRADGSVLRRSGIVTVIIPVPDTSGSGSVVGPVPATSPEPAPVPSPTVTPSPADPTAPAVTTPPASTPSP